MEANLSNSSENIQNFPLRKLSKTHKTTSKEQTSLSSRNCLKLKIKTKKKIFSTGEPIKITFILENICDRPLIINQRFAYIGPDIYFYLRDESGKDLKWLPPVPLPPIKRNLFRILKSNQQISKETTNLKFSLHSKLLPGTYTIAATYKNSLGSELDIQAWTGEVNSNPILFEILNH